MLAEVLVIAEEEAAPPAATVLAVVNLPALPAVDPLRYARVAMQRSVLTYSLLDRALACGGDILTYERIMREFIWTPPPGGR